MLPSAVLIETRRQHATSVSYVDTRARKLIVSAPPSPPHILHAAQRLFLSPTGTFRTRVSAMLGRWGGRQYLRDGPVLTRLRLHHGSREQMIARAAVARNETRMTMAFLDADLEPTAFAKIVGSRSDSAIRNEYTWLSRLRQAPTLRQHIPAPLRCWHMNGLTVLELAPVEHAPGSANTFSELHSRFLEQLQCCTRHYAGRGEPLPARIDRRLSALAPAVSPRLHRALTAAARALHQQWDAQQRRVVAHGDFTPWNVLVGADGIRVVDWESAVEDCPPLYDYFHFTLFPLGVRNGITRADVARVLGRVSAGAPLQLLAYLLDLVTAYLDADDGQNERSSLVRQYSLLLTRRAEWSHPC